MKKIFPWLFVVMLTIKLCFPTSGRNSEEMTFERVSMEFPGDEAGLKVNESFETWPPAGWTFASPDGGTGWFWYSVDKYPLFGGATGAAAASNSSGGPLYNEQWLISPPVSITEGDKLSFWMLVVNSLFYEEKVDVMISVAGNKTDDFKTVLESITPEVGNPSPWTRHLYDLSPFAGKTIHIALRETQTDKTQKPLLLVDLFQVGAHPGTELAVSEITVPAYLAPGPTLVTGKLLNLGMSKVLSVTLNYQIDQGKTETTVLSGLNILSGSEFSFSCTPGFTAVTGNREVRVWISDVNFEGIDENNTNDILVKTVQVATRAVTKIPLLEEFTSSTCPPCAVFNAGVLNPFITTHTKECTVIKYQMNWPGLGDPYYTSEGGSRRTIYGINGVPTILVSGKEAERSQTGLTTLFNSDHTQPTYFSLSCNHRIDISGKTIKADISVIPYINSEALISLRQSLFTKDLQTNSVNQRGMRVNTFLKEATILFPGNNDYFNADSYYSDFRLFAAVVENETTGNVRTNGEKIFYSVMMKMIPDATGSTLNCLADIPLNLSLKANLEGTHIEQYTDLSLVVFIQNIKTKEIVQSAYSTIVTSVNNSKTRDTDIQADVFPNPFVDVFTVKIKTVKTKDISAELFYIDGRKVGQLEYRPRSDPGFISFNWSGINERKIPAGIYFLKIKVGNQEIVRKLVRK